MQSLFGVRSLALWGFLMLQASAAVGQEVDRPNVAILIYDGVQIIDHAGLADEGWTLRTENLSRDLWTSSWSLVGRNGGTWSGEIRLEPISSGGIELHILVAED